MNSLREEIKNKLRQFVDDTTGGVNKWDELIIDDYADKFLTAVRERVPKRRRRKRGMWYFDGWFDCRALLLEVLK